MPVLCSKLFTLNMLFRPSFTRSKEVERLSHPASICRVDYPVHGRPWLVLCIARAQVPGNTKTGVEAARNPALTQAPSVVMNTKTIR